MAKATIPIIFLVLLIPALAFGGCGPRLPENIQKTWCVAKPSTLEEDLLKNINYACSIVGCTLIRPGGNCFNPNVTISHASAVMNLLYEASGRIAMKCDIRKSGLIVQTDPSFGTCNYA